MYAHGGTTRHRRLRRAARVRLAGQSVAGGPRHSVDRVYHLWSTLARTRGKRTVTARFLRHLPLKSQFCHLPTALRRRPPRLRRPAAATARSIPSSLTAVNHGAGAQRKMSSSWLLAGNSCLCQRTLLHTLIRTAEQVNHCLKLQEATYSMLREPSSCKVLLNAIRHGIIHQSRMCHHASTPLIRACIKEILCKTVVSTLRFRPFDQVQRCMLLC
ncbi:hypothetical protein PAHAL_3G452100 [Panicum hallii]|uniref:Uncharacterized protein n=1 Tax=Panicum hallii TaxID=206008 RepID=A0A2T8KLE7_9POAL|nr:hypothetical protein PAHAL_3G452100 [Panicum hallii]